ncbi:putative flippase GtrA [Lysobacter niastensis]|uniref:Flippase GtrA n=1 Tax=Lysobacter niastensis TaxID=380629 RepID=A0ABU1WCA2_9GAMM|nr:GtrA family protein [Lysobacter niastensis]MDR7135216.1 putative flippase GtrA [Lysobacter niastensis]
MISTRFIRFLAAGGVAAVFNFGSRIALSQVMPYVPAIAGAYCIGMTTAFMLNRLFVFDDSGGSMGHQATWFVLVNLAAVVQTIAMSVLFARWVFPAVGMSFHPETVAHALGVAVPVFTSYLGHKHISFRSRG